MVSYNKVPYKTLEHAGKTLNFFPVSDNGNIDVKTVESFGEEWKAFNRFDAAEIEKIGNDYFDILPSGCRGNHVKVLDVGCGSGRWAAYLAPHVGFIDCIDPSNAVFTAAELLKDKDNIRISQADIDNLPFAEGSFDLVYSLGVLHHIPDTEMAMRKSVKMVKPDGYFLVYLYYSLDNRGWAFKSLFKLSAGIRRVISKSPTGIKKTLCNIIGVAVYWPLAKASALLHKAGARKIAQKLPLSYYRDKSLWIMKNDALDRFGTPLEQRFSRVEIEQMMLRCGLSNITFSNKEPYWHAIGQRV